MLLRNLIASSPAALSIAAFTPLGPAALKLLILSSASLTSFRENSWQGPCVTGRSSVTYSFSTFMISSKCLFQMLFVPTQKNFGEGLCARATFFLFSVFSDFEIDDFWHLWYIIVKPLKSLFICTKGSLLVLFVWKLRGFKVLKNEQMNSEMRWTASISSFHLSPHMYIYKR